MTLCELAMTQSLEQRFAQLLDQHGAMLRHLVSGYEANPALQDELFQDIALAIWSALPSFRQQCAERTFMARIAHNRLARHVDKVVKRVKTESMAAQHDDIPCRAGQLEERMVSAQRANRLLSAVRKLAKDDRQLVSLALEGFSYQEIAEVVGMSSNHIGVRLNRAKARLKSLLEGGDE